MEPATSAAKQTETEGSFLESDLEKEKQHFQRVVNAFLYYRTYASGRLQRLYQDYLCIPVEHQKMLPSFPATIDRIQKAIDKNYEFVRAIISSAVGMFEDSNVSQFDSSAASLNIAPATSFDMEKVKTTIKQFYRDWSKEGSAERSMCYGPITAEVLSRFPRDKCQVNEISILVPGAGLGRLAYELARLGYTCQGNEFSMFMLLASNFILNQTTGTEGYTIHPWVHQYSNNWSCDHQVAEMKIPDVNPSDLPQYGLFSMAAGDFLEIYTKEDEWDCVACCFFIDTAHNIIELLQRIHKILKPGGIWINFGPLLYHFADMPGEHSIELSWDEVHRIAESEIGFEIIKEERRVPSHYIQNPHSMIQMTYSCVFMVARKKQ